VENILAVIDLGPGTDRVFAATCKYAEALQARVILVNVEPLLPGAEGSDREEVTRDLQDGYAEEIKTIHDLGADLSTRGIDNRVLIIEGTATDQLLMEADREAASLIILGSYPHGAFVEALTHGLREQLAKRVRCPVLLVPVS